MKEISISIFKNLYDTEVPYNITLEKCLNRIKEGKSKDVIERIRKGNKKLKYNLPSILFAGEFSVRNKKGLVNHSGMMVIDIDKINNIDKYFNKLKKIPYFVTLFVSPSGDGIKGVVKIPQCDARDHEKYFKEFAEQYKLDNFDISNCNVDRVCFESYDPNIYINYNAEEYCPDIIDNGYTIQERVPVLPMENEFKIIELIMGFKWNKSFVEGQRNNYILDISSAFCEYGVNESSALSYLSSYACKDFTQKELENTVKNAYRIRSFGSKFFEDNNRIRSIKKDLSKGRDYVIDSYNISVDTYESISNDRNSDKFWNINNKGKVSINPMKYKFFLESNGFKKYFHENSIKPTLVYINSNKVEETSTDKIKDFVLNYLDDSGEYDVWDYCASFLNLFSENYLSMLSTINLMMLRDTKNKSFISFKNGILEVTKNEVKLVDYIDVYGYVWKRQIIDREFTLLDTNDNDYKTFIGNISNNNPFPIQCVIGYLISTYKNKMNNKAIILNDEVISENPEGGTGKGLFIQGVKQIRRTAILDGKSFDDKKSFPYQTVSQDTNILVFDDVKKNFNFETKFSLVTEGLTLERKNKDAVKLTVEDSPKLVISTNYAIKGEGNSHDRRRHEIEFAQYYGAKINPLDEFNKQLFDDWDDEDWLFFDNYMVECLKIYLTNGLVAQNAKNIKLRRLVAETSMEFYEWISELDNVPRGVRNNKSAFFDKFLGDYPDFKKWLTRKRFNIWIKKYCSFKDIEYSEGNSNGDRWFEIGFSDKEAEVYHDKF